MRIDVIQKEQLHHVAELAQIIWPVAYCDIISKEQLNYMLDKFYSIESLVHQQELLKHEFLLVFNDDNKPIAYASFGNSSEDNSSFVKLHKLYVLPECQGNGIGKSIIDFLESQMKREKKTLLRLNVNRKNIAVDFYKKSGFEIIGVEDIDIGNGYFMNDFVMEKKIAVC